MMNLSKDLFGLDMHNKTMGLKGIVNEILSDHVLIKWYFRFTTVSLKALCEQVWIKYSFF